MLFSNFKSLHIDIDYTQQCLFNGSFLLFVLFHFDKLGMCSVCPTEMVLFRFGRFLQSDETSYTSCQLMM